MMSDDNKAKYLQQLAKRVLAGKATEEEKVFLEEYYKAFEKHPDVQVEMQGEELQNLKDTILQEVYEQTQSVSYEIPARSVFSNWRWRAAASVLVLLSVTLIAVLNTQNNQSKVAEIVLPKADEVLPGSNKATLTLNNGSTIVLDDVQAGALVNQGNIQVSKTNDDQLIYTAAKQPAVSDIVQYNTVATPKGGQYQVVLPDGTRVWLNAASSIHFPTSFTQSQRVVSITGEVYFEVFHNASHPFIVNAGSASVQVLGTHFNIMAYANENMIKTTLAQGSVKVNNAGKTVMLHPGEQAQADGQQCKVVKNVDVEAELAWKNGLFFFKDASIETVMRQVERWYDISVKFEGKIPEKQFNGKVPRNVNLSELMEILSFYDDMKCEIEGNTITIKR